MNPLKDKILSIISGYKINEEDSDVLLSLLPVEEKENKTFTPKELLFKTIEIVNTKDCNFDIDEGMIFKVTNVTVEDEGTEYECYRLFLNFENFEDYNRNFMKSNYYDDNGNPTLTWEESGFYPTNKIVDIYIDSLENNDIFKVIK